MSVAPVPDTAARAQSIFSRRANEEHWKQLLQSSDLVARQADYDRLLLRALVDPTVEQFMRRMALDESLGELSWTARLGLRELDLRHKLELGSASANSLEMMGGPYGSQQRLKSVMQQLVIEYPALQFGVQSVLPPAASDAPVGAGQGSGPTTPADPSGRVRVRTDVLGVHVQRVQTGTRRGADQRPGLVVALVQKNSIAAHMQLASGDVLLRVNGQAIYLPEDISKAMASQPRSEPITVNWIDQSQIIQTATWTPDTGKKVR